jgi:hypothetical protein
MAAVVATSYETFGPPEIQPEEVELIRPLGSGAFGTVWLGRCRAIEVAVKVPNVNRKITQRQLEAFQAEVKIMSKIFHPHVALFMGASTTSPDKIRIVSERLEGDVEHLIQDKTKELPLFSRMKMVRDAATGMAWLHGGSPVCLHRDFKTSNLLYDANYNVKVCDFGLSQLFEKGQKLLDEKRPKGTPLYMAPEVWLGKEFNEKADVYSFGIVLWELLMREAAFAHHSSIDEFKKAITQDGERPPIPADCISSLRELMTRCWDKDPNLRPYFPEICDKLNEVCIEAAIRDRNGAALWKKYFAKKEWVPWEEFVAALYGALHLSAVADLGPNHSPVTDELLNLRCLRALLAERRDNKDVVGILRFGELLGWFGPLQAPATLGNTLMDQMRIIMSHPFVPRQPNAPLSPDCWFFGYIGPDAAQRILSVQSAGTFLVRFSSNAQNPTWYTISKVSSDKKVRSIRIEHEPGGEWIVRDDKQQPHRYATLPALIHNATFLHLAKAAPGSPYQYLFASAPNAIGGYERDKAAAEEDEMK